MSRWYASYWNAFLLQCCFATGTEYLRCMFFKSVVISLGWGDGREGRGGVTNCPVSNFRWCVSMDIEECIFMAFTLICVYAINLKTRRLFSRGPTACLIAITLKNSMFVNISSVMMDCYPISE